MAGQDPHLVVERVQEAIGDLVAGGPSFRCEMKVLRMQEGFALNENSALLKSMVKASGKAVDSVAFGTEAPWLNKLGAEAVVFGPGSMLSAHSPREFVPKSELVGCVEILTAVILGMCSQGR